MTVCKPENQQHVFSSGMIYSRQAGLEVEIFKNSLFKIRNLRKSLIA